jgi:hypothetical protein
VQKILIEIQASERWVLPQIWACIWPKTMGLMALRIVAKQKTPDIQAKCSLWLDLTIALSLHHQAAHLIKTNSFFINQ